MHKEVQEAAVIGVKHESRGEVPKAYIVLHKKNIQNQKEIDQIIFSIRQFVNSKVASFKQIIGGFVILAELPKTESGKVIKSKLENIK